MPVPVPVPAPEPEPEPDADADAEPDADADQGADLDRDLDLDDLDDPDGDESAPVAGTPTDLGSVDAEAIQRAVLLLADLPPPRALPPERQHDPSAALGRLVRARDHRCDGPGCTVPSPRCELDHLTRWPDGPTSSDNLRPRSQRCHHAKHAGWTTTTTPAGTTWTSPAGRRYTVPRRTPALLSATGLPTREPGRARALELGLVRLRHDLEQATTATVTTSEQGPTW